MTWIYLFLVPLILFGLPLMVYLCVKLGTLGFFKAKQISEQWKKRTRKDDFSQN